ncbi:class A beta-lactamase [Agromyces seonyuensis]|uniref:Beta-lactamase n=1 Tax=Agromyces seonyuensis TaxID=2662446 RepID=A0A6I4P2W1_9MICO|nr:class A beta-lactamase [Agromyces seonyuensis]MWB99972.1 class A beta-lactamase [Agromyces seonyuensis]
MTETHGISRRSLLALGGASAAGAAVVLAEPAAAAAPRSGLGTDAARMTRDIAAIERRTGVTIGVAMSGAARRDSFAYRATETFPMCSLFKVLAAAALIEARACDEEYWTTPQPVGTVVEDSQVFEGLTEATPELAADAALRFSDNTAGNYLLRELGGPAAIGAFAARFGARSTRLDRWEPELNEATPGDPRDTTTPADIARVYRALVLEDAAGVLVGSRLRAWMLRNRTSDARMRAGLDRPYDLADKTGGGSYGVVNDAGVLWRPGESTRTIAILTRRTDDPEAPRDNTVVAEVTRILTA